MRSTFSIALHVSLVSSFHYLLSHWPVVRGLGLSCREVATAVVEEKESDRDNVSCLSKNLAGDALLCMLDTLSDDTILHIVQHATIKERARMSSLNKRLHKLLHEVGLFLNRIVMRFQF
uniref:F-box domain-containing protein n=1 Tax=Ascaris lumbricoides TaxID=6252 RepID=A0A9J2Q5F0_ASCLU